MKKIKFSILISLFAAFTFTACSSDDDNNAYNTEDNNVKADSTGRTLVVYYS